MSAEEKMYATVRILDVPYCLDREYEYYLPPTLNVEPEVGALALVPFGQSNRKMMAAVVKLSSECEYTNVKPVLEITSNGSVLSDDALGMCTFLCGYTLCTFGEAVRTVLPSAALAKTEVYYSVIADIPEKIKSSEKALLIYNFIKLKKEVSSKLLRSHFGEDGLDVVSDLVRLKYVKCDVRTTESRSDKFKTFVSLAEGKTLEGATLRSPLQREIAEILGVTGKITTDELYGRLGKNASAQVNGLAKKGIIVIEKAEEFRNSYKDDCDIKADVSALTEEQKSAYSVIESLYSSKKASAALLHGVTGSGKTRVIKAMTDRVLSDNKGVIILVPEISLTPQTVGYFCKCYGERVAVIHSGLSKGERYDAWKRIRSGDSDVVIGTRSAVFAPVKNLGMIVIDEEQEHTYKSDTDPKYLAHDVARYRAGKSDALMLLSSATPSLTSYYKAKEGKYTLVEMNHRYGDAKLPEVVISDMRSESDAGLTSPIGETLTKELVRAFENKKQSIVFLNRRGYNSAVSCRICGEAIKCPRCSVSLTYHTKMPLGDTGTAEDYLRVRAEKGRLACHYCGYKTDVPKTCPSCSSEHFRYMGCGTQQAEEELKKIIPEASVLRMDMDTTSTKDSHRTIIESFRNKDADILLGTQMVTKGHDFPDVTLVGVLNADGGLNLDDYRAGERTFSMLTQVIGRAGRAKDSGIAVVQTHNPESEIITLAAKQDYKTFYEKEIKIRRALVFPPFCDIAVITLSSENESVLGASANAMAERVKALLSDKYSDVKALVFGPFEAPIYKIQNTCRMRICIKCRLNKRTRMFFSEVLFEFSKLTDKKNMYIGIDFNPTSL